MSGYPHNPSGYGYGQPPPSQPYSSAPYGGAPPPSSAPYGVVPPHGHSSPYGSSDPNKPSKDHHAQPPSSATYGGAPPPSSTAYGGAPPPSAPSYGGAPPHGYSAPYGSSDPSKPQKDHHTPPPSSAPYGGGGYAAPPQPHSGPYNPFSSLTPSIFPPGTDPNVIACFQMADQDGSGFIDDKELQKALSSYNQSFGLRTVHLLMYLFTNTNIRKIGPKEFSAVFYSLQNWREIFERFDKDRSGKIDSSELRDALHSLGYAVYGPVLELLVSKFDKTGGMNKAIEYDNFIECCLTVKGLTEKFKEKDTKYSGSATFTYESFMLTILPFLIA